MILYVVPVQSVCVDTTGTVRKGKTTLMYLTSCSTRQKLPFGPFLLMYKMAVVKTGSLGVSKFNIKVYNLQKLG